MCYKNLKKFHGLVIPNGAHFNSYAKQWWIKDKAFDCRMVANIKLRNSDPRDMTSDHKCFGISCCDCIFWDYNYKQRYEYFKSLNENK